MLRSTLLALFVISCLSQHAMAQTKISGVTRCDKPSVMHVLPVGDRPDHSFAISKGSCKWEKPLTVKGARMQTDESTGFSEVSGNSSTDRYVIVGTTSTGDKVFVRTQGTATLANGTFQSGSGTWTYQGGTGALKTITGKGAFKCTANTDGSSTCNVDGEYRLSK